MKKGKIMGYGLVGILGVLLIICTPGGALAGDGWITTTVDSTTKVTCSYTSLALDAGGHVHISYWDWTNWDLKYATNTSGSWVLTTVDSTTDMVRDPSLALDADGHAHIGYWDFNHGKFKYATNASGSWVLTTVDSMPHVGGYISLALDAAGHAHISYYYSIDATHGDLMYATNASGSWVLTTVDSTGDTGRGTSLALDAGGHAHIGYYDSTELTNGKVKYATNASGDWVLTTVDSIGYGGGGNISLALDAGGHVHISYQDVNTWHLKYATNATGDWVLTTVDSAYGVGVDPSLAVDADGHVHISYYDLSNAHLKYATNATGSWVLTTVDSTGDVGRATSLALDAGGHAHISYVDTLETSSGHLKYATNANATTGPYCVSDATQLQAALTAAQDNNQDDVIQVVQGIYTGNFTYSSGEGHSLTLEGGYTAGCADRVVNPSNTILDGGGTGKVLTISTTVGTDITVDGFTVQNGYGTGITPSYFVGDGGGISINSLSDEGTSSSNILLTNNIVTGNTAEWNGGGIYVWSQTSSGKANDITVTNNIITHNTVIGQPNGPGSGGGICVASWSNSGGTTGNILLANNIVAKNDAELYGGGIEAYSYSSNTSAIGAITLTNNTITGNTSNTRGGGADLPMFGGVFNVYNNILWGNTALTGGDISLSGNGTSKGYNNDYTNMSGRWSAGQSGGNIDAYPLFVDFGHDNYRLSSISPCIDMGNPGAPGLPATDFEGDARIIGAAPDIGADEFSGLPANQILQAPSNGTIFTACSLFNKSQPTFQWMFTETFSIFTIYFSTDRVDFSTRGVFITMAIILGKKRSWTPAIGTWRKIMAVSYNNGRYQPIYWKVVGTRTDRSTVSSAVWSFRIDAPYPPEILAPVEGASLPAATTPQFQFDTACNVKFRLEVSSVSDFSDHKKIKAYTYMVPNPNVQTTLVKQLSKSHWTAVKTMIGVGNTGYFRVRGWDRINRLSDSVTQSFTITTP